MGASKRIFESELQKILKKLNKALNDISKCLPKDYNFIVIEKLLMELYPFEYKELCDFKNYYDKKEKYLISHGKKSRFYLPSIEKLLKNMPIIRRLLRKNTRENYKQNFIEKTQQSSYFLLKDKRDKKNEKRKNKLKLAEEKMQLVEPEFLDKLMGIYNRKNTSQENRMYIFSEIEKYYCDKTINFFRKLNDTEHNTQLRERAVRILQEWGHYIRLRKGKYIVLKTKNKKRKDYIKKIYKNQKTKLQLTPNELEKRIEESLEQRIKSYDYFISHSSKNISIVKRIKDILNKSHKTIYCDWISDGHYLKRTLIGEATKLVIDKRLEQSKELLFVDSINARKSKWVKYELNYFYNLRKKMYIWDTEKEKISEFKELWFLDKDFKDIKLY